MLYSEFVAGTGCRENEHNYKVYKNLEIMYMNSDMSKDEIYEYGKKLVNNTESEEVQNLRAELKAELDSLKKENMRRKETVDHYKWVLTLHLEDTSRRNVKRDMKWEKQQIKENRIRMKEIRFILG